MPAITATAPGKIILFGEHAVVYNQPAIAVPVSVVQARATVTANPAGPAGAVQITARDIGLESSLTGLPDDHPIAITVRQVLLLLGVERLPALRLQITSSIPIAAGLGSGTAISVAVARALSAFLGNPLEDDQVSHIAYIVDQKHHGTPSGIDNTVIAYAQPVYFIRGKPFERLCAARPITLVIGNTGVASPTVAAVGDVRRGWQADPPAYERMFDAIGTIAEAARQALESGTVEALGPLMTRNQELLRMLDVSSPGLDRLAAAALAAGAGGAKLSGGGRGGNMIALATPENAETIAAALREAGAVHTIITHVGA